MANRPNNIWAKAAAGSPGTNIARAQQSRWTGIPNEAIMRLVEDRIGSMLEGISGATERNAAAQTDRLTASGFDEAVYAGGVTETGAFR